MEDVFPSDFLQHLRQIPPHALQSFANPPELSFLPPDEETQKLVLAESFPGRPWPQRVKGAKYHNFDSPLAFDFRFHKPAISAINEAALHTHGLVVVVGPSGSGKVGFFPIVVLSWTIHSPSFCRFLRFFRLLLCLTLPQDALACISTALLI
jgi:hypothetical protein